MDFSKNQELVIAALLFLIGFAFAAWAVGFVQALWWDESIYAINARDIRTTGAFGASGQEDFRAPLLSVLLAVSQNIAGNDAGLKYLAPLFSGLALATMFLLARKFYGTITAVIAALLLLVSPLFLFYSTRVLPEVFMFPLTAITMLLAWKGFVDNDFKQAALSVVVAALAFLLSYRFAAIIAGIAIAVIVARWMKKEKLWNYSLPETAILILLGIVVVSPAFLYSQITRGTLFDTFAMQSGAPVNQPWYFYFQVLPDIANPWGVLIITAGLAAAAMKRDTPSVYIALTFIISFAALTAFGHKFDRYLLPVLVPGFVLGARALVGGVKAAWRSVNKTSEALTSDSKASNVAFSVIVALVLIYGFVQMVAATPSTIQQVQAKGDSYGEVKEAGLYLMANTAPQEYVMSDSPQTQYYAERRLAPFPDDLPGFLAALQKYNPRYIEISLYEGKAAMLANALNDAQSLISGQKQPTNPPEYVVAHDKEFEIAQVFFRPGPSGSKQPQVIIFRRKS
ncbi:MAG TPA: glycosyltransferase family 39 protein [Candidatus Norongarragalinales archaeon]|jgi:4-amino-4-deoxy-L-arabinose transferase-like glycosyltransferase|nr:glycosyltransferase family 39 protein [Candidatus Norongarragalinales archaeon]